MIVPCRFKTVKQDGRTIKFQIWDTAGQERFRTITSAYYKGADGILMVYDLTEPSSIDDLENYWIQEAYNYCDKGIKVLLLGNKSDCERSVSKDVTGCLSRELTNSSSSTALFISKSAPRLETRSTKAFVILE